MPEDRELVARAQAGEGQAFAQLYEKYLEPIYRYVAFRVGSREEAEDVTGEVFLKALQSLGSYKWQGLPFSSWLFRIAHNLMVDRLRRQKQRQTVPLEGAQESGDHSVEEQVALNLRLAELKEALGRLSEAQRQAILLRLAAGLSVEEAARAMGRSPGAIKALQHSGLKALRRHMASWEIT